MQDFELLSNQIIQKSTTYYSKEIIDMINDICLKNEHLRGTNIAVITHPHKLTTDYDFTGYNITAYLGIVNGQTVLGTGFLSEFTASFTDFFGEKSNKFADKLEQAKQAATEKMILKSHSLGGNAIIDVDFDYITFHGNMIAVVVNGTSVKNEEVENIKTQD